MAPEAISPVAPRRVRLVAMRQTWTDAVFLHWEIDPASARRWLPRGTRPDLLHGRTYVGLIGLRADVALLGAVPVPYLGSFAEINVRLYSIDQRGRRGIVFRSLDADRLVPAVAGLAGYGLPYRWSAVQATRRDQDMTYTGARRWPGKARPTSAFSVRLGDRLDEPSELELFLTARWVMHWSRWGRPLWCATEHEPWPLHRARVLSLDDGLVAAAGLPQPSAEPASALWSPGVRALIGAPKPQELGS